jgi:capsular exopolysaccharide synthesis family protein
MAKQLAVVPQVVEAQQAVEDASRILSDFRAKLQPGHPKLDEAIAAQQKALARLATVREEAKQTQLGDLKAYRRQELVSEGRKFEDEHKRVSAQLESAEKEKTRLEERMRQLNLGGVNVVKEKDELDPLREEKNELTKQKMQLDIAEVSRRPRVELKEGAQVYMNYNLKQKMVMATGAGVVGLLGVMLLISFLEWRNRRVDGVAQVVTELGMRVIGTIPAFPSRASLRSGDAGANQNWRFILNESVNSTRTMLLHTAKTQQMQVIMVTSAMQGEGKTSLSSQLATSMATAGLRTLILDFDLRNPSMQKLFDVQVAPGCCEVLLQEVDVSDCVQPTSVPNLWILPAGQCNHRVIAALAQGHPVEQLFGRLRGQYDVIIVDSCPVLPVADSLLVAQHVDGVVFSILQDVSQLPKVLDASEKLVQLNIPLLGAVVNGIKPDIQAYGYNYVKQLPA